MSPENMYHMSEIQQRSSELMANTETLRIPEFGKVKIIPATGGQRCVDPREQLDTVEPDAALKKLLTETADYSPYVDRTPANDGDVFNPGATAGDIMSLMAAMPEMPVEQAVDLVFDWCKSEGRKPSLHEDDHTYQHTHGLGCGHVDRASMPENEELYGLPSEKVRAMTQYIYSLTRPNQTNGNMAPREVSVPRLTNLHQEKYVMRIISKDKTVIPNDDQNNESFRYDLTRHEAMLDRLASYGQERGIDVDASALKQASGQHTTATLTLLAPNLPVFDAHLEDNINSVTYIGKVPSRQAA